MLNMSRCVRTMLPCRVTVQGDSATELVADRFLVHEALVRQIEQVVVDELIVGAEMVIAVHRRPGRIVHPMEIRDRSGVGERWHRPSRSKQTHSARPADISAPALAPAPCPGPVPARMRLARRSTGHDSRIESGLRRRGRAIAATNRCGQRSASATASPGACGTGRSARSQTVRANGASTISDEKAMTCQQFRIHIGHSPIGRCHLSARGTIPIKALRAEGLARQ